MGLPAGSRAAFLLSTEHQAQSSSTIKHGRSLARAKTYINVLCFPSLHTFASSSSDIYLWYSRAHPSRAIARTFIAMADGDSLDYNDPWVQLVVEYGPYGYKPGLAPALVFTIGGYQRASDRIGSKVLI